uniref:Ribosome biogenesis protein slx9-like n=1 Tax=Leersia perrieri TaxID=77586 RepID=A0A0D9VX81_9ORYZ
MESDVPVDSEAPVPPRRRRRPSVPRLAVAVTVTGETAKSLHLSAPLHPRARFLVDPPPDATINSTTGPSKKQQLKSKQKLEKKLSFYTKVKDTVTSLNATKTISKKTKQRSRKKKLKAYDLSAFTEFLPETDASKQDTETKLNCKSKQALVQREAAQLNAVLTNPQFQLDPFAAIHQHLLSTQPPSAIKESDSAKQGKNPKDKKRKKSKKKKNASSTSEAMDI